MPTHQKTQTMVTNNQTMVTKDQTMARKWNHGEANTAHNSERGATKERTTAMTQSNKQEQTRQRNKRQTMMKMWQTKAQKQNHGETAQRQLVKTAGQKRQITRRDEVTIQIWKTNPKHRIVNFFLQMLKKKRSTKWIDTNRWEPLRFRASWQTQHHNHNWAPATKGQPENNFIRKTQPNEVTTQKRLHTNNDMNSRVTKLQAANWCQHT